jgi:hypothetical protein
MKNTIITSLSALVFLVIGLFIGKSNKQIEIQTVVKTNIVEKPVDRIVEKIVEKPVKEYIDKYITNVVEKLTERNLTDDEKQKVFLGTLIENSKRPEPNSLPKDINSIRLNVLIGKSISEIISDRDVRNKLELDIRKTGVQINENAKYLLNVYITAFPANEGNSFVFRYTFNLNSIGYYFADDECYKALVVIWEKESSGIVGKLKADSSFNSIVEKASTELCNLILKSKQ